MLRLVEGAPATRLALCLMLVLAALWPLPTAAQDAADTKADTPRERQHLAVVDEKRQALLRLIEAGPLVFKRTIFVTQVPHRYGEFTPRPDTAFLVGEPMIIYIEPIGLVWKRADDLYRFEVEIGLAITHEDGRIIADEKAFGRISGFNRQPLLDVMNFLELRIATAPPGRYSLVVTYRDAHSDKAADFRLLFEIEASAEAERGRLTTTR